MVEATKESALAKKKKETGKAEKMKQHLKLALNTSNFNEAQLAQDVKVVDLFTMDLCTKDSA